MFMIFQMHGKMQMFCFNLKDHELNQYISCVTFPLKKKYDYF